MAKRKSKYFFQAEDLPVDADKRRDAMKDVCSSCHAAPFVGGSISSLTTSWTSTT